jgi:hypothetical protein
MHKPIAGLAGSAWKIKNRCLDHCLRLRPWSAKPKQEASYEMRSQKGPDIWRSCHVRLQRLHPPQGQSPVAFGRQCPRGCLPRTTAFRHLPKVVAPVAQTALSQLGLDPAAEPTGNRMPRERWNVRWGVNLTCHGFGYKLAQCKGFGTVAWQDRWVSVAVTNVPAATRLLWDHCDQRGSQLFRRNPDGNGARSVCWPLGARWRFTWWRMPRPAWDWRR